MKWFIPSWNGDVRLVPHAESPKQTLMVVEKPTPEEQRLVNAVGAECAKNGWLKDWAIFDPKGGILSAKRWEFVIDAPLVDVGPIVASILRPGPAVLTAIRFENGQCLTSSGSPAEIAELAKSAYREAEKPDSGAAEPHCDMKGCKSPMAFRCVCPRCKRESMDEVFFSCSSDSHRAEVAKKHKRIRDREIEWLEFSIPTVAGASTSDPAESKPEPEASREVAKASAEPAEGKPEAKEPKAAATVRRPTPSCPQCLEGAVEPATEALLAFLDDEQHRSWAKTRTIVVEGGITRNRYLLAHRNSSTAAKIGRICYDLDDQCVAHFHDLTVPPEEEVLAAMLILAHREPWLRNEATMLGLRHDVIRFKNPFGDGMDGAYDAQFMRSIGQFLGVH